MPDHARPATYVALLRGVNVGGRSLVSMAALRDAFERLGHRDVRTYLQSGNVLFSAGRPPDVAGIEAALRRELGVTTRVIVRTPRELASVVERDPLRRVVADAARYVVVFLSEEPARERIESIDASAFAPDVFRFSGREVYAWFPNGMGRSRLMTALSDRRLGVVTTARNWKTVNALLERSAAG